MSLLVILGDDNVVISDILVNPPTPSPEPLIVAETAVVIRVIDGDTIEVILNGETERVRYIGIDTPEYNEVCGTEAAMANATLVNGQKVRLEKDVTEVDVFGRLLRYVYVGDMMINAELVSRGWAIPIRYPPDTMHAAYFERLQTYAMQPACISAQPPQPTVSPPPIGRNNQNEDIQDQSPILPDPPEQPPLRFPPVIIPPPCNCTGPDLDCSNFSFQVEAQACYDYCFAQGYGDRFDLDRDDGKACDNNP